MKSNLKALFLALIVLTLIFFACKIKNKIDEPASVASPLEVRIVLKKDLGLVINESIALVISFNDKESEALHVVEICFSDRKGENYNLSKWFETKTHPSSSEFSDQINQRWKKDFLLPKVSFIEVLYYSEPAGKYKVEAIYYPRSE